jgi:3D (Asp-Asp-Asp) domain-containing protein
MKNIGKNQIIVAFLAILVLQQLAMVGLFHRIQEQSGEMGRLESDIRQGYQTMDLVRRMALNNHADLQDMQRKRTLTVTAYSPRRKETDSTPGLTATNSRVRPGIVAVSRDLFDNGWVFGRKVYIKNYGVYTIDDLMHERKTDQIDIFIPDTRQALQFGRKELEVYLLDT